jgi:hypothetical protein
MARENASRGGRSVPEILAGDFQLMRKQVERLSDLDNRKAGLEKAVRKESNPVERRYLQVMLDQLNAELSEAPTLLRSMSVLSDVVGKYNARHPERRIVLA